MLATASTHSIDSIIHSALCQAVSSSSITAKQAAAIRCPLQLQRDLIGAPETAHQLIRSRCSVSIISPPGITEGATCSPALIGTMGDPGMARCREGLAR